MKFSPNIKIPDSLKRVLKRESTPDPLREPKRPIRRNPKDNIPLNFRERSNARLSLIASIVVLAILVLFFNQLDYRLRTHPQVVCMERTNARYLTREQIPDPLNFFSVDVSFISLNLILPALRPLMQETGEGVCLVKPQFEAGKDKVGKKGVVRDPAVHLEVLEHFLEHAAHAGFSVKDITFSPIRGPEGNIEYLGYLSVRQGPAYSGDLSALVSASHGELKGE